MSQRTNELIEEGTAAIELGRRAHYDVVVIGAGQAGLSVGYYLARAGRRFVILDAHERVGDSWRKRWDSLRLFTPAKFDGLVGMRFPAPPNHFPTKEEMADYLEAYAARFRLPVRTGARVERLSRRGDRFVIRAGGRELEADQVVVAMANYQRPKRPAFAAQLSPDIVQVHSADYRNLAQLRPGPVLIVGGGNSGAELALEMARGGHPTLMAGRDTGEAPIRLDGFLARTLLARLLFRVVFHRVLTVRTPMGRRARPHILRKGHPLIRVKNRQLAAVGVKRVPRVAGVREGRPQLEDGQGLDVANVIWCTGFDPGFSWIDLPIHGDDGELLHDAGVAPVPGLYFVGLGFLYAMSSAMIHGVGRDAARIVEAIEARTRAGLGRRAPDVVSRELPAAAPRAASL
jgi:putative flavoprotein involved in K+ transport